MAYGTRSDLAFQKTLRLKCTQAKASGALTAFYYRKKERKSKGSGEDAHRKAGQLRLRRTGFGQALQLRKRKTAQQKQNEGGVRFAVGDGNHLRGQAAERGRFRGQKPKQKVQQKQRARQMQQTGQKQRFQAEFTRKQRPHLRQGGKAHPAECTAAGEHAPGRKAAELKAAVGDLQQGTYKAVKPVKPG